MNHNLTRILRSRGPLSEADNKLYINHWDVMDARINTLGVLFFQPSGKTFLLMLFKSSYTLGVSVEKYRKAINEP